MVENDLAHTHALWSNLYILVALDILKTLFKAHLYLRDNKVVIVNMLANNLTIVNLLTWIDEELTTILKFVDRISIGSTSLHSNHRTVGTANNITLVWLILFETVSHDSLTLRSCEHISTQTDDTT